MKIFRNVLLVFLCIFSVFALGSCGKKEVVRNPNYILCSEVNNLKSVKYENVECFNSGGCIVLGSKVLKAGTLNFERHLYLDVEKNLLKVEEIFSNYSDDKIKEMVEEATTFFADEIMHTKLKNSSIAITYYKLNGEIKFRTE